MANSVLRSSVKEEKDGVSNSFRHKEVGTEQLGCESGSDCSLNKQGVPSCTNCRSLFWEQVKRHTPRRELGCWYQLECSLSALAWMDGNAAAKGVSGDHGRIIQENDSLDWLKDRLQGLGHPLPDNRLPFTPDWGDGASGWNNASGNTSRPASGGNLQGRFPPMAQVIGPSGGVQSAFMPFQAPLVPPLASSMNVREAPAVPPPNRFRLFGFWVESAAAESGRDLGSLLGGQKGGFQEQQDEGWEQQLSQVDGESERQFRSSLEGEERRDQPRLQNVGIGAWASIETFARNTAFWKGEEGAPHEDVNPGLQWRVPLGNERQAPQERNLLQGGGAWQYLERRSSGEKGDLASQKLHFGPESLLLYGGKTDPVAGGFGFFREDAAYLKRQRAPEQLAQRSLKAAQNVNDDSSGVAGGVGETAKGGADGGWFDLSKETTGGLINIFEEDLRPKRMWSKAGTTGAAAPGAGGLHIIPFQLTTAGGFAGLEGVTNSRSRHPPRTEAPEQQAGRSSARLDTSAQAPVGARGPKSRADWMAEQAAHELLTLAFAQQVEEAPPQGPPAEARQKAASLFKSHPSDVSIQRSESLDPAHSVAQISADTPSSEDDQPLARRQGGGATPTKPQKESPQVNRLPLLTEKGHSQSVAASLQVAENEAAVEADDRCNYHSGKAKKGWRCKNPKLKGFKICVFHRKQRLDRRQMSAAASPSAKSSPATGASAPPNAQPAKPPPSSAIPRPPKKRPHAFLDLSPGGTQPSPEESDKQPPRRKRRSLPKPRNRLVPNTVSGGTQAIEGASPSRKRGVQAEETMGGGSERKEETHGDEHAAEGGTGGGLASPPGKELADEERCTYRSGAQGKWRCKRQRHANFKFCQFHRESQKKYWDKKNQARRMLDKKKS
ncbi:hypothetical protein KFL_000120270 [Klebsormidium nitens]|uniref:WRC domain-containing protein n=1 Tax=Klebsormidium nitens TaxID=105231 RepID=A0A1Y1HIP7_KLENI|nr:hypothetical protein KFL_000120270 [Klebsormidium nitens]|eukprot:GAQ78380.1 hypothetical protein KFL_000120270 [Klebsormidium nitens]